MKNYYENSQAVMEELEHLLEKISSEEIDQYVKALLEAHLEISCHMVGDLNEPPITDKDLLVVGSGSGESVIPLEIAKKAKSYGATVIHLTSNPDSSIAKLADHIVKFDSPSKSNQTFTSIQPMTTVFEQGLLIFHDVLALRLMNEKQMTMDDLKNRHANLE